MKSISKLIPTSFLLFTTSFLFHTMILFFLFFCFLFIYKFFFFCIFLFSILFFFLLDHCAIDSMFFLIYLPNFIYINPFFIQEHALQGLINKKGWYHKQERIYRMNYH